MNIRDSVAILTGACSSDAQAVALQLAKRGVHGLALVGDCKASRSVTQMINQHVGDWICYGFQGDLANAGFRRRVYTECSENCGTVNIYLGMSKGLCATPPLREAVVGLIDSVAWAKEMIIRLVLAREVKRWPQWHAPEPPQGLVMFVAPQLLSRGFSGRSLGDLKEKLKIHAQALAVSAEQHGIGCNVLFAMKNPFDELEIRAMNGKDLFTAMRMEPKVAPQALSEVICSLIEGASVERLDFPALPSRGNGQGHWFSGNGFA